MRKHSCILLLFVAWFALASAVFGQSEICIDHAPHEVHMVEVEPDVQLEVLDWGGTGNTIVFLAGISHTGHAFDNFVEHFVNDYRVIAITRRGFGKSSQPDGGYDSDTRSRDILKVLDELSIEKAILIGHSFAGDELSRFAVQNPSRVEKLVYIDAPDVTDGLAQKVNEENPLASSVLAHLTPTEKDLASPKAFQLFMIRSEGLRMPLANICQINTLDRDGKIIGDVTGGEIFGKSISGAKPYDYGGIQAPVLAIFSTHERPEYILAFMNELDEESKSSLMNMMGAHSAAQRKRINSFQSGMQYVQVVELPSAHHVAYISHEGVVANIILNFLAN